MNEAEHHARAVIPENMSPIHFMLLGLIPEFIRDKLDIYLCPRPTQKYFKRVFDRLFADYEANPNSRTFSSQMMSSQIPDGSSATKGFTKREIIANAILVILAGQETTASTLQFVLYKLAVHPDIQDELYDKVKKVDLQSYEVNYYLFYNFIDYTISVNQRLSLFGCRNKRSYASLRSSALWHANLY